MTTFAKRSLVAATIAAGLFVLLYFFNAVANVLLLMFAGVLLSIFLRGIALFISHYTPLGEGWSLVATIVLLLVLIAGVSWLGGPRLADQFDQLSQRIPEAIDQIESRLEQSPWGRYVLQQVPGQSGGGTPSSSNLLGQVTGVFSSFFGMLANGLIVLVIGLYIAIAPEKYVQGALYLVPAAYRERAHEVMRSEGHALRWWLIGRIASMIVVGILTAVGLIVAGIPLAFTLGFIAAVLSFVPYVGPIASLIPMALVALAEDPNKVIYVFVIYAVVQLAESYLITPLIQERAVSIPPALLIAAQTIVGVLAGLIGILLATPLTVFVIVLVQMLYVRDVLGEDVKVLGTHPE